MVVVVEDSLLKFVRIMLPERLGAPLLTWIPPSSLAPSQPQARTGLILSVNRVSIMLVDQNDRPMDPMGHGFVWFVHSFHGIPWLIIGKLWVNNG